MTNWDKLVSGDELHNAAKERKETRVKMKIDAKSVELYKNEGWQVSKEYSNGTVLVEKEKKLSDRFENEVWMTFYKMGFKIMNSTNDFKLSYSSKSPNLTKQIDVVAIDDEVCLFIECKTTEKTDYCKNWKSDLESIKGNFRGLCDEIGRKYPNRKCKYIFATMNYVIGDQDIVRMNEFNIANFDYDLITYYSNLVNHLGSAARYQLLGNIFAKQSIKGIDERVPAIEGEMGGLTYYSFLIEPERLLKLSYILHRNNANDDMMPTYQRLIKKERLKSIREFVNNGGYFPNSLIVSIDTNNRNLVFDRSSLQVENSNSKIGILHLPKTYQSIYIIDGQHRLYGYSDSHYSTNNFIPVVAFINMDKHEQVKMFMDINVNQKSVSKSLKNTLYIDLLWNAPNYKDRNLALMLNIAQKFGEDYKSPLYGRIITGENTETIKRCITIDYVKDALFQTKFFNEYKNNKNDILRVGTFDRKDNEETRKYLYPFLLKCFKLISEYCADEWDKGKEGFLTINNCIYALIRIFDDIVNIVLQDNNMNFVADVDDLFNKCQVYLYNLADTINSLDFETKKSIKEAKGGGAKKYSWRKLQVAFHQKYEKFINQELNDYIIENCTNNNPLASEDLEKIEKKLVELLRNEIDVDDWLNKYVPESTRNSLISKTAIEKNKRRQEGSSINEWYFVSLEEVLAITKHESNWSNFCQKIYAKEELSKNKMDTTAWLDSLIRYKNKISTGKQITKSEYEEIKKIYNVFFKEEVLVGVGS